MNNMNLDYVTLHYRSVLNDFSNQFSNEEFSDCVLNAEGRSLKVHKAMLCAQSSFLEKIVLEHQSIGDLCFIVEGVAFEDLKSVVQFMYNGSTSLTKKKVGSFLVVAELLGVKWLDRIQLLSDTDSSQALNMDVVSQSEPKASLVVHDGATDTQSTSIPTPSSACSVFKNLTNVLDSNTIKRKKHMKNKKHCKKSKCAKEDHKHDRKRHKINHTRHAENIIKSKEKAPGKETHLADMDESTFCTTLGLKKNNEVPPRELSTKSDSVNINSDAKIVPKSRSVPPLIKINREVKSNVESAESRGSNLFVSEINTVYIEDKNLSFINIGANELCIRENNIEIECDVLDASSSQFVIEKETSGNIVEIREDNLIQAEFVDINPESTPVKSELEEDHEPQVAQPVVILQVDNIEEPRAVISYPSENLNATKGHDSTSVQVEQSSATSVVENDKNVNESSTLQVSGVLDLELPTVDDSSENVIATCNNNSPSNAKSGNEVAEMITPTPDNDEVVSMTIDNADESMQSAEDGENTIHWTSENDVNSSSPVDSDVEKSVATAHVRVADESPVENVIPVNNDTEMTPEICINEAGKEIEPPLDSQEAPIMNDNQEGVEQHETPTQEILEIGMGAEVESECNVESLPENNSTAAESAEPLVNTPVLLKRLESEKMVRMKSVQHLVHMRKHLFDKVVKLHSPIVYEKPCRKTRRGRPRLPQNLDKQCKTSNDDFRPEDHSKEHLIRTYNLKPFVIKLKKYQKEESDSEKLNFLSNFNLKRRGFSPISQNVERPRLRSNSIHHKKSAPIKTPIKRPLTKRSKVVTSKRARTSKPIPDLSRFKAVTVELEKLKEDELFRKPNDVLPNKNEILRKYVINEHNYNVNPEERRLSTDISLSCN